MSNYLTCDVMRLCESFYKPAQLQKSCGHGEAGYLSSFFKTPPPPHPHFVIKLIITLGCLWAFIPVGMYSESLTSSFLTDAHTVTHAHTQILLSLLEHSSGLTLGFLGSVFSGTQQSCQSRWQQDSSSADIQKIHFKFNPDSEAIIHSRKLVLQTKGNIKFTLCLRRLYWQNMVSSAQIQHMDEANRERLREKRLLQGDWQVRLEGVCLPGTNVKG